MGLRGSNGQILGRGQLDTSKFASVEDRQASKADEKNESKEIVKDSSYNSN